MLYIPSQLSLREELERVAASEAPPMSESTAPPSDVGTNARKSLRQFGLGAQVLRDLGVKKIRLLTNNPRKIVGLRGYGLEVSETIPLQD